MPDDDSIPEHELEMSIEGAFEKPIGGSPAERQAVLKSRVDYLAEQMAQLAQDIVEGKVSEQAGLDEIARLKKDLAHARQLLEDFQHQSGAQN